MSTVVEPSHSLKLPDSPPLCGRDSHAGAKQRRQLLRRDLKSILVDGITAALMIGLGEAYLAAYALALGLDVVTAGMLVALPMLSGSVLQLFSPWAVARLASHRRWVVLCAGGQAFSLLLMPAAMFFEGFEALILFLAATLYWGCGLATGPAWNTWIEEIVPRPIRPRFFAHRARAGQFALLSAFVLGGLAVQVFGQSGRATTAFAALFVIAAAFRFISMLSLAQQSEPHRTADAPALPRLRELAVHLRREQGVKLLVFMLAMQLAVQVSGPFFAPYMLVQLHLTYVDYMVLIAVAYLAKTLAMPYLGTIAKRFGPKTLLWLGGLGVAPIAALWIFSTSFYYLVLIQVLSGMVWAAYELAGLLMFFETIPRRSRTTMLTLFNLANSAALVGGAAVGAVLLGWLGEGIGAYQALFGISSVLRVIACLLLVPAAGMLLTAAKPCAGWFAAASARQATRRPILATLPEVAAPPGTIATTDAGVVVRPRAVAAESPTTEHAAAAV